MNITNSDQNIESALASLSLNDTSALATLAPASRAAEVRTRLAEPAILNLLLETIDCAINESIETLELALRCLGNACIDNDDARDEVTSSNSSWARRCLAGDDQTKLITTKVLYNICHEHEPSQKEYYQDGVHHDLITYCGSYFARDPTRADDISTVIDLLFWIVGHKATLDPSSPLPEDVLATLVLLPAQHNNGLDVDTFGCLVEIMLTFLRDPLVQQQIIEHEHVERVFSILHITDTRALTADPEDLKVLQPLEVSLVWCLSDIAALPDFAPKHPLGHATVTKMLLTIEEKVGYPFVAACEVLGNLLWKTYPQQFEFLVLQKRMHNHLLSRLCSLESGSPQDPTGGQSPDAMPMHSIAGLLIQLSRPSSQVRRTIGDDELCLSALQQLCRHDMPQIKQDGIKLLRALGTDCPANQGRFGELGKEVVLAMQQSNGDTTMIEGLPS